MCAYSVFNTFPVYPLSAKPLILLAFCRYRYHTSLFNRPGFQEALALIQHRRVGRFIVKDLSRLGRNTVEVGKYIGVVFPRFGVEFISVHDGPESGDPDSLITQFKNIMNEYYAKDISDKQKLSLQARSNSGRHIASTPTYGYKLDPMTVITGSLMNLPQKW